MSQQINLYSTALPAPRERFSAEAVAAGIAVTAGVVVALCVWSFAVTRNAGADADAARAVQAQEQAQLTASLAGLPSGGTESGALEQQLAQAQTALQQRRAVLDELTRGQVHDGNRRSAMLRRVAQTVPATAWLTQIDIDDSRLELVGRTLQPEHLRPWLAELTVQPIVPGQPLAALKIERDSGAVTAAGAPEPWVFTVVSKADVAARTPTDTPGATP